MKSIVSVFAMMIALKTSAAPMLICSALNACAQPGAIDQVCATFDPDISGSQEVSVSFIKQGEVVDTGHGVTFSIPLQTVVHRHTGDMYTVPAHQGLKIETDVRSASLEFLPQYLTMSGMYGTVQNRQTLKTQFLAAGPVLCQNPTARP